MSGGSEDAGSPAARPDAEPGRQEEQPRRGLLVLRLGDVRFGLWVDEALEVVRTPPISQLPLPQLEVAGVTSVRGDVVPVLDLGRRLLDAPAARPGRLVLVRHEESGSIVGLLVDAVDTLLGVAEDAVREPPADASLPREMVAGIVAHDDGVVTILHLGHAVAPPEATRGRVERT